MHQVEKCLVLATMTDGTTFYAYAKRATIDLGQQIRFDGLHEHIRATLEDAKWHMGPPTDGQFELIKQQIGVLPPEVAKLLKESPGIIVVGS